MWHEQIEDIVVYFERQLNLLFAMYLSVRLEMTHKTKINKTFLVLNKRIDDFLT